MKKEELIALGVSEEIAKQIMSINGTDIEAAKTKASQATEKVQAELDNTKLQLESKDKLINEANVEIEKFKGTDIEGIKKSADDWKTKYETFETQSKADKEAFETQLKQQAYDFKLKEATSKLKFPNELTREAFENKLKDKNLPFENEKFLGFDDYVKEIGEQNPGMFVVETQVDPNTPVVQITAPTSGTASTKPKMTLTEAMKIKNAGGNVDFSQIQ